MRRVLFALSLLAVCLAVPVAVLVVRALESAAVEDESRHRLLAERVFDEMEEALSRFLEAEEARPFESYEFYELLVTDADGQATHARVSPLARMPEHPFVLGYFQIDPDGSLHSPRAPRERDRALAQRRGEYQPSAGIDDLEAMLQGAWSRASRQVRRPSWPPAVKSVGVIAPEAPKPSRAFAKVEESEESEARKKDEPAADRDSYDAVYRSLNQAGERRAERKQKLEVLPSLAPAARRARSALPDGIHADVDPPFESPLALPPRIADALAPTAPAARERIAEAFPAAPDALRVVLDPMVGRDAGDGRLLLYRTVVLDEQAYRQGMLVDWRRLGEWLDAEVIDPSGLGDAGRATWFGSGSSSGAAPEARGSHAYVFRHLFAEPFDAFGVELGLPRLPDGRGTGTIHALWMLLALVTAGGLVAVYRMVGVVVQFAERRSRFAASISHELKTPLTSIRMYGEMLRDGLVANEAKRNEYYRTISDESERLSRLIDNVLDFSRLERGEYELRRERGSIVPVLEAAVEKLRPHVERQGFALRLEAVPALPEVELDRDALTQVVFNLVDNALKYAAGAARKEIVVSATAGEGGALISVRDFGPGVPRAELAHVFEPFYRGEDELTRSIKGTGIGLALVRELVESLGGRVRAANAGDAPRGESAGRVGDDAGGGFLVTVFLPACAA